MKNFQANKMDYADNYGFIDDTQRDSNRCESSQLKLDFAQLKQENYYELNDLKFNQIVKKKNGIVEDGNEQKFESQYLISSAVSPEKQQGISQNFEKDNISDKMVNFSKLLYQILNAKVVVERMCEYSGMNEQSAKKRALPSKSLFKDSVQLYCPKCQTVTVDAHSLYVKKSCSKCKSTLKYMCSKCNVKHYNTYEGLIRHLHGCGLTDSTLKELKPFNFLVKKTEIDYSKEIIRYCSRCNEDDESSRKWAERLCRYCDLRLLYQCSKCKAQYKSSSALLYHMHSKCYPSQYKCNQCAFTSAVWENMRQHVINVHLRVRSNIEPPAQVLNAKTVLRILEETPVEDTVSQAVKVYTNVNILDSNGSEGEKNCNKHVQHYCTTCNKTKFVSIVGPLVKNCSDCKTAMTFLCIKCNEKHYKRYQYLLFHMDRCEKSRDVEDMLEDDVDCSKPIIKDKYEDRSFLDRSQFILKEFESVSSKEKWIRYCSKCGIESVSNNIRRCTCNKNLFYMCKKCNVKCNSHKSMVYHSKSRCFPDHQYKCTDCNYSTTLWKNMQLHFRLMHTNLPTIKCGFCSYETKLKGHLTVHIRRMHGEIKKLFHCNSCSYSTKFEINLQRHEKLNH